MCGTEKIKLTHKCIPVYMTNMDNQTVVGAILVPPKRDTAHWW